MAEKGKMKKILIANIILDVILIISDLYMGIIQDKTFFLWAILWIIFLVVESYLLTKENK